MKRRHDYFRAASFLGVTAAALVVAAGCGHAKEKTVVVRLKAIPAPGHRVTDQDLRRSASIMRERLRKVGVPTADVRIDCPDVIAIEAPKIASAKIRLAAKTALLEFYDFEASLTGRSVKEGFPIASPTVAALLGTNRSAPEGTVVVSCKTADGNCVSAQQVTTPTAFYLFKNQPALTSAEVDPSGTRADIDPQTGRPVVLLRFTERGKRIFGEITRREAKRGAALCAGEHDQRAAIRCAQHFAIVLDHEIVSLPYIDFARNPDGIPGDNGAQIDLRSIGEAKALAQGVATGALPVRFIRLP